MTKGTWNLHISELAQGVFQSEKWVCQAQVGDILVCKCFHFEAFSAFIRCIKHKLVALTAAEFITFSAKRIPSFTFRIFYVSLYFCVALLIYNISCGNAFPFIRLILVFN